MNLYSNWHVCVTADVHLGDTAVKDLKDTSMEVHLSSRKLISLKDGVRKSQHPLSAG